MLRLSHRKHTPLFGTVLALSITGSLFFFMNPFTKTEAVKDTLSESSAPDTSLQGKKIVVNLEKKTVTLSNDKQTPLVLPIISQGKPGSYYETIGGSYTNDYKIPLHFSSLGQVYMPYSVHVFGQYFIHGIPYYPNGEKVSSLYSGGCVRLSDENAKLVYDFVEYGTPIIITREDEKSFGMTPRISEALISLKMTLLMTAIISLETLDQEVTISDKDGTTKTRKELLPKLITQGEPHVLNAYVASIGKDEYLKLMNIKAKALGMSSTHFKDLTSPAATTYDDYLRFMAYISTYKSYLLKLSQANTL